MNGAAHFYPIRGFEQTILGLIHKTINKAWPISLGRHLDEIVQQFPLVIWAIFLIYVVDEREAGNQLADVGMG